MNHMLIPVFLILTSAFQVQAIPSGFGNCPAGPGFGKNVGLIQKATMIGGEDRQTLSEYAAANSMRLAEVRKRFAATGVIACGSVSGTVQLSGKTNLVTSVSHIFNQVFMINGVRQCKFFEPANCTLRFPLTLTGSEKVYKIKDGSMHSGGCTVKAHEKDWSVFELTEDVRGATPYDVPPTSNEVRSNTPVLQVAQSALNFHPEFPPTFTSHYNFQNCYIRDRGLFANVGVQTDCDTGVGASGGAQLATINERLTLMAINAGQTSGKPSGEAYNSQDHFNFSVPLEGELLRTLHERLGTQVSSGQ